MPEVILIPSVEDNGRKRVAAYCRVSTTNEASYFIRIADSALYK